MNALLLSAGLGTRMRPVTLETPKCLLKVNNKTLLEIWMQKFLNLKINNVLLNTHHLAEKINIFVEKNFKQHAILSFEPELLGTAQTIIKNYEILKNDDCIIVHSDNYCEDDLKDLIKAFKDKPLECLVTMMVFRTEFK